ncbi:MAG TPA: response regulator [Gemmatimonadales bacterium]|nr:response regulator [Gemmatimonadales bacterium]
MTKILLVEDNDLNRDMLTRRLTKRGYEVLTATDGEQGLVLAQAEQPDLVLMDMSLPGIDGWETTRRLRAGAGTAAIPVIALTAHAMAGDRERALEAGCDDYDTKPVEMDRLLLKIESLTHPRP